jgi:hypothetical protein
MTDLDLLVLEALEEDVPFRRDAQPDWPDVLGRASGGLAAIDDAPAREPGGVGSLHRRPRWLRPAVALAAAALAATVIALVTPVGGAITRGLGGFSDWLTGAPGQPAPTAEQRRFDAVAARGWAAFPERPELRELIRLDVGSANYVLYGFRSGNAVCLRLSVSGLRRAGPVLACAARSELERSRELVIPVKANVGLGSVGDPPRAAQALVSFGFVAASVRRVELGAGPNARSRATVANAAFLHVLDRPGRGESMRTGIAVRRDGRLQRFRLAVYRSDEESGASRLQPRGPAKVERTVTGGTVGWFERREPRGEPLDPGLRRQLSRGPRIRIGSFARVIRPDSADFLRLVVAERAGHPEEICTFLLTRGGIGGSCTPIRHAFSRGPMLPSWGFSGAGQQFWTFQGITTDVVTRVEVFLATGERRPPLPFRDNVVLGRIPAVKMPARVVAYDRTGRVVSVWTIRGPAQRGPRPKGSWEAVARVDAQPGPRAVLSKASSTVGGTCLRLELVGRSTSLSCYPKRFRSPVELQVQNTRLATFVYGRVQSDVDSVELRYRDGAAETVKPIDGFLLHAVPAKQARDGHRVTLAIARDAEGTERGRQPLAGRRG